MPRVIYELQLVLIQCLRTLLETILFIILEAFHELGKDAECESSYIQHIF